MYRLIDHFQVAGVVGNVGTPTAVAALPIVRENHILFYAPYTGAGRLRKKNADHTVINYRASYAQEVSAMIEGLVKYAKLEPSEIAFFTQRDSYGDEGFSAGMTALKKFESGNITVAHGRYERNTTAVENGLADILSHSTTPKAVILVGTYEPCARFIKVAKEKGDLNAIFLAVSFVGTESLTSKLGRDGNGVIVTQVVPHYDPKVYLAGEVPKIVLEYQQDLEKFQPNTTPTFSGFEGYISMRIFNKALATLKERPSRKTVVSSLLGLGQFRVGLGLELQLTPEHRQACQTVWPTIINHGQVLPFKWEQLAQHPALKGR